MPKSKRKLSGRLQPVRHPLPRPLLSRLQLLLAQEGVEEVRFYINGTNSFSTTGQSVGWSLEKIIGKSRRSPKARFKLLAGWFTDLAEINWIYWISLMTGRFSYSPRFAKVIIRFDKSGKVKCWDGVNRQVIRDCGNGFDWRTGLGSYEL